MDDVAVYRNDFTVTRSAFCFLEVLNKQANKGNGLKLLCETIGIDKSETVSFGDELNDISMIEYAGLGVAMANAVPEVKKAADLITESNTEDGLAKVLDRIIADQS
jgi:Cof subfamily protein (haloacid dehalogenase superfamily)